MRNILLIVLDATRYDIFQSEVCPYVHSLGEKGIVFLNYYSTAAWSLPAHASLFTGLHLREHGVEYENMILHESVPTLAERFKVLGYQTVAFSNNPWISPTTGLDRGFDIFHGIWHKALAGRLGSKLRGGVKSRIKAVMEFARYRDYTDSGATRTNKKVGEWRKEDHDESRPFFMFVNYMETHGKLKPPEPYRSRFYRGEVSWEGLEQDFRKTISGEVSLEKQEWEWIKQLQRAELAYVDSKVRELVEGVLKRLDPIVVVTSDHGDLFGEEDPFLGPWAGHKYSLHRALLHVPLVIGSLTFLDHSIQSDVFQHSDLGNILLNLGKGRNHYYSEERKKYGFAEHTNPKRFIEQFQDKVRPLRGDGKEKLFQHLVSVFDKDRQIIFSDREEKGRSCKGDEDLLGDMSIYDTLDDWKRRCKSPPPLTGSGLEFDEAELILLNLGLF